MKIKLLLLFIFSLVYLYGIELTENEQKWLNERKVFKILVSSNNEPYEFINNKGEIDGINIDIYKEAFRKINKRVIFTTDASISYDIDAISSFTNTSLIKDLATQVPFTVKYYMISLNKEIDLNSTSNIYTVNQNILRDFYPELDSKNHYIYSDINLAYADFLKDENSVLIIDNLRLWEIDQLNKKSENAIYTSKLVNEINAFLWLKQEDKILYSIVSKTLNSMIVSNQISQIIQEWENKYNQQYQIIYFQKRIIVLFTIFSVLFILIIYFLYRFRVLKNGLMQNAFKSINKNKELYNENHELQSIINQIEKQNVSVLDNITNIAMTFDLKGNIKYVNKSAQEILGYQLNYLIGTNISEFVSYEDKIKLLDLNPNNLSKKHNEIQIQTKEGFNKHFIYSTHFTKSAHGHPQINCILQDITDRISLDNRLEAYTNHLEELVKQRTYILKKSEERFRFIFEKAFDGIFLMEKFQLQLVNESFCQISGLDKDDLESIDQKSFLDFIPEEHKPIFLRQYDEMKGLNAESFIISHLIEHCNGQIIEVETHFSSINYNEKQVELGIMHDIQEKRNRENQRIEHEKFMAVSSFSVTANDKINSPLNAISGYVELLDLQLQNKTDLHKKAFKNIYISIEIIKRILNKLRSLTDITIKSYSLEDLKMIKLEEDFSTDNEENDGGKNE